MSTTDEVAGVAAEPLRYVAMPGDMPRGTLTRLFFEAVDRDLPDALLRRGGDGWQPVSHRDVLDQVRTLTHALRSRLGVNRGDRVAPA